MRKLLLIVAAMAFATTVGAAGHYSANTISGTASIAGAAAGGASAGNGVGFAVQGTSVSATNVTSANAYGNGVGTHNLRIGSGVSSAGTTSSLSSGVQGASGNAVSFGITGGLAVQGGIGSAEAHGGAFAMDTHMGHGSVGIGVADTGNEISQGSLSATANVNNGAAISQGFGLASSSSDAAIHINANHHSITTTQSSNTDVLAGGGNASAVLGGGVAFGAGAGSTGLADHAITGVVEVVFP